MSLRPSTSPLQYGGSTLVTGPAVEPVTAAQLQAHLRTDSTLLPDADADQLILEARTFIEELTGLALINQTWKLTLDDWPRGRDVWWSGTMQGAVTDLLGATLGIVEFPRYPLSSLTSATTYDEAGNATVEDAATLFVLDVTQTPGRLTLASGQVWPSLGRPIGAVELIYVAGYGAAASAIPAPLTRAILQSAAYLYSHRGDGCSMAAAYTESGAAYLAGIYDVKRV